MSNSPFVCATDFSYVTRVEPDLTLERFFEPDQWFIQYGRKVFKELLPMVTGLVKKQLEATCTETSDIKRLCFIRRPEAFLREGCIGMSAGL
ncbi:MAG: hypothetical protein DRH08_01695 [Deltaproteobacteria bacterium]|nr:MAG: hypothetical protein DRH08_01695 [Deltaproteobacteria bacterium]